MNADELKAVQAPFKQRYLEDPAAATITLRAQSRLGEGITSLVENRLPFKKQPAERCVV